MKNHLFCFLAYYSLQLYEHTKLLPLACKGIGEPTPPDCPASTYRRRRIGEVANATHGTIGVTLFRGLANAKEGVACIGIAHHLKEWQRCVVYSI